MKLAGLVVLAAACLLWSKITLAEPVVVRYTEGLTHGFLTLQTLDGKTIADGEMTQVARGDRVTSHLTYRFRDGSLYDDTVNFSQQGTFRVLTDHLIQKGPSFPQQTDTFVDASTGEVTVRYKDKDGAERVTTEKLDLKPDLANGLMLTIIKDIQPSVPQTSVSMVVATPKPRVVTLQISPQAEDPISVGKLEKNATHYVVKVKIGGIAGIVAPIIGKQPADTHVWIVDGGAPGFIQLEGPLFDGGPVWRTQLATPAVFKNAVGKQHTE
ncbi:MAG: hypothetical protein JWO19_4917 [Bryobacterales bacterium]|jgi:hypothetical protein|nr:hypothetical protein [Bryobacterales bacterium]